MSTSYFSCDSWSAHAKLLNSPAPVENNPLVKRRTKMPVVKKPSKAIITENQYRNVQAGHSINFELIWTFPVWPVFFELNSFSRKLCVVNIVVIDRTNKHSNRCVDNNDSRIINSFNFCPFLQCTSLFSLQKKNTNKQINIYWHPFCTLLQLIEKGQNVNPLNPNIKIWILICCPYSFLQK